MRYGTWNPVNFFQWKSEQKSSDRYFVSKSNRTQISWPKITEGNILHRDKKKNEKRAKISPERVASQMSSKCRTEKVHVLDHIQRFFGMPVDYRFISGSLMTANNNGSTHSILMHNKYHILCKLQYGDEYEETKKYSSSGREDCFNFCPTKR